MEERKITLVDDEQTLEFYVLEETKLNGSDYLLVTDAEDEEERGRLLYLGICPGGRPTLFMNLWRMKRS